MSKELNKEMLQEMGITNIEQVDGEWVITRDWYSKGKTKIKTKRILHIYQVVGKHKYSPDRVYNVIGFSYQGKVNVLPLARVLYAWFVGPIPAGNYDVDHVNNISTDESDLKNLQLLTREQNLAKRYLDNPNSCHNQFDAMKKYGVK